MSDRQCPQCPEQMAPVPTGGKPFDYPGDEWVYRCSNGHERPATSLERAMLR